MAKSWYVQCYIVAEMIALIAVAVTTKGALQTVRFFFENMLLSMRCLSMLFVRFGRIGMLAMISLMLCLFIQGFCSSARTSLRGYKRIGA